MATGERDNRVSIATFYEELDDGTVEKQKEKVAEINEHFSSAKTCTSCLRRLCNAHWRAKARRTQRGYDAQGADKKEQTTDSGEAS